VREIPASRSVGSHDAVFISVPLFSTGLSLVSDNVSAQKTDYNTVALILSLYEITLCDVGLADRGLATDLDDAPGPALLSDHSLGHLAIWITIKPTRDQYMTLRHIESSVYIQSKSTSDKRCFACFSSQSTRILSFDSAIFLFTNGYIALLSSSPNKCALVFHNSC